MGHAREDAVLPTDLVGTWTLTRVVDDRLAGERRHVVGTATLSLESPDRVRWSEEGTMTWGGRSVEVGRTLYVERGDGGWFVYFSDGRPFHPWSVGSAVEHPCGRDLYAGRISGDAERWTVEWRASGPEKDYVMTTVHTDRRDARPRSG
jgi:hypothetical protein